MAQAEFTIDFTYAPSWADAKPVTRESFLAAYVDAHPYRQCEHARTSWEVLHDRAVISNEIDEDPS